MLVNNTLCSYSPREIRLRPSEEIEYNKAMNEAKENMRKALLKLQNELCSVLTQEKLEKFINLSKRREESKGKLSFDDVWDNLKNIFDSVRDDSKQIHFQNSVNKLKELIMQLVDAGIPLDFNKKLNFWSTQLGRVEAEGYSVLNNGMTDAMATLYFRRIFLEWPEENLNIFLSFVTGLKPLYPDISLVFWTAISDIILDTVQDGSDTHVFFQDSLTIGNYFWNVELPKAREKNMKIFIHIYDITKNVWKDPINLDSPEGDEIFLRRRTVHKDDKNICDKDIYKSAWNESLWQKEYKDGPGSASPIKSWSAPQILTWGKLRSIAKKIISINKHRSNRDFH